MVLFPVTLSDPKPGFQGDGVIFRPINALNVLSTQLTRDLFAIAKFLLYLLGGIVEIQRLDFASNEQYSFPPSAVHFVLILPYFS